MIASTKNELFLSQKFAMNYYFAACFEIKIIRKHDGSAEGSIVGSLVSAI